MQFTRRKNKSGFTLIETLIAAGMVSAVSLVIYGAFSNGSKVWQRINSQLPEKDINIFFDRFSSELRNTFLSGYALMPALAGNEEELEFNAFVNSRGLKANTLGRIRYVYNPGAGILEKKENDFSRIYNEDEPPARIILENIPIFRFEYYFYDKIKQEYVWLPEWKEPELPLAVRVELEINKNGSSAKFIKTVNIPISN